MEEHDSLWLQSSGLRDISKAMEKSEADSGIPLFFAVLQLLNFGMTEPYEKTRLFPKVFNVLGLLRQINIM